MPIAKVIKVFEKYLEEMHQAFDKVTIVLILILLSIGRGCVCESLSPIRLQ